MNETIKTKVVFKKFNELFDTKAYGERIYEKLRIHDQQGFTECVDELIENLLNDDDIRSFADNLEHLASSVQYKSTVFGRWIRFRLLDKERGEDYIRALTYSEEAYFEELHELMPERDNLLFSEDLEDNLIFQFGGNRSDRPTSGKYFSINDHDWELLKEEIKENIRDPKKFILGQLESYKLTDNGIKNILKKFKGDIGLKGRQVEVFKRLLFTFYYTIAQKCGERPFYHIIIPFSLAGARLSAYCGAFKMFINMPEIENIKQVLDAFVSRLYTYECLAMRDVARSRIGASEDSVRLCSFVNEPIPPQLNQFMNRMNISFKKNRSLLKNDADLKNIVENTKSACPHFLNLISDLEREIEEKTRELNGKTKSVNIYFYGEPGLGKESLAQLAHYFKLKSRSLLEQDSLKDRINSNLNKLKGKYKEICIEYLSGKEELEPNNNEGSFKIKDEIGDQFSFKQFNFRAESLGSIKYEEFPEVFFGNRQEPGVMTVGHILSGSVFMDEVNTMDRRIAGGLLRAIQDPFWVRPVGLKETIALDDLLVIFAGNESPERLRSRGINSAFVDRITQICIPIPPLRERATDIAVIFNHLVRKKNENKKIRFIDLNALRFLIELKWKGNVRDLQNLVDHLFAERKKRALSIIEKNTITFKEVIRSTVKRDLM